MSFSKRSPEPTGQNTPQEGWGPARTEPLEGKGGKISEDHECWGVSGAEVIRGEEHYWDGAQRAVPPGQGQHSGLRTEPKGMAYRVWRSKKRKGHRQEAGKAAFPWVRAGRGNYCR